MQMAWKSHANSIEKKMVVRDKENTRQRKYEHFNCGERMFESRGAFVCVRTMSCGFWMKVRTIRLCRKNIRDTLCMCVFVQITSWGLRKIISKHFG